MNDDDILTKLTTIFRKFFEDPTLIVTSAMTAKDVARWDSLSHVDMIVLVEESFGIRIPVREVVNLKNVGDLVRCVRNRVS